MATRKYSADDGNLNSGSLIAKRNKDYIDIDLDFDANTNTGDIFKFKDANAVKEAVKNLIQTNFFERPYQPFLGTNLRSMMFNLNDDVDIIILKDKIRNAINNYEPRAQILDIDVDNNPDKYEVDVTIQFRVVNTSENVVLSFSLEKLR